MKRRTALRSLALVMGGTLALPAWAQEWQAGTLLAAGPTGLATPGQEALLAELVETIIPTTDSPGAKALGVHLFILKMLADCYEKAEQERFIIGLEDLGKMLLPGTSKSFMAGTAAQRLDFLQSLEAEAKTSAAGKKPFFPFLKSMTIQGYLNSAYVMRDVFKYELVPARYHGCVPVKTAANN
jgi:hypothetical protein